MKTGVTVLGSGSKGNSIIFHTKSAAIIVDAGFSRKEFLKRADEAQIDLAIVQALLITHEHSDHVRGARVIADYLNIPTYTVQKVYEYLKVKNLLGKDVELFHSGSEFSIGEFQIYPFSVSHDALEPVAFTIQINNKTIGLATDLGHLNNLVKYKLSCCDLLILEANHDVEMLMKSDRSINLKRRIRGKFGHLNNEDAMNSLNEILHKKTKNIIFYHLSSDCNCREMVFSMAEKAIYNLKRQDINLTVAHQDSTLNTVWI